MNFTKSEVLTGSSAVQRSRGSGASEVHEQRIDQAFAAHVQRGVDLLKSCGERAAIVELRRLQIPEHIVLRVVSGAAFRRKDLAPSHTDT